MRKQWMVKFDQKIRDCDNNNINNDHINWQFYLNYEKSGEKNCWIWIKYQACGIMSRGRWQSLDIFFRPPYFKMVICQKCLFIVAINIHFCYIFIWEKTVALIIDLISVWNVCNPFFLLRIDSLVEIIKLLINCDVYFQNELIKQTAAPLLFLVLSH